MLAHRPDPDDAGAQIDLISVPWMIVSQEPSAVPNGGYFACPEVAGRAERDLRGYVWPLPCPPTGRPIAPGGGRRGTEATRSPRVGGSARLPASEWPGATSADVSRCPERLSVPTRIRLGLRDIVLRAYASKTPGRIAAGLSGSPPVRIAGGLPWADRPVRSVERSSPYRTDRCASSPAIHPR